MYDKHILFKNKNNKTRNYLDITITPDNCCLDSIKRDKYGGTLWESFQSGVDHLFTSKLIFIFKYLQSQWQFLHQTMRHYSLMCHLVIQPTTASDNKGISQWNIFSTHYGCPGTDSQGDDSVRPLVLWVGCYLRLHPRFPPLFQLESVGLSPTPWLNILDY